jgi:membrane protein
MQAALRQLGFFFAHVLRRFDQDRCLQIASSLTFTTLLALVPLITIALTLVSVFPVFSVLGEEIRSFLLANMLPEVAGKVVAAYLDQFTSRAGRLTALGTAVLAVTAFLMMFTIERAFNSIWRVPQARPAVRRFLIYWAVLTFGPVLMGASLSITSYIVGASLGFARQFPGAGAAVLGLVPFVLTCAALTLLYYLVPNRAIRPRHALAGGIVAGLAFEVMKRGFAVYIAKFPTYTLVYGAFAAIPIFLLWVYCSWAVVIVGALIVALAPDFSVLRSGAKDESAAGFSGAMNLLLVLARAQQVAELPNLGQIARRALLTGDEAQGLVQRMLGRGWVTRTGGDRYGLVCDADKFFVAEVYREFALGRARSGGAGNNRAVNALLDEFAARADDVLNLSLRQLLEGQTAPIR